MSLIVKGSEPKTIQIEDGLHFGTIQSVDERLVDGKDYSYLDLVVALEDQEVELKVGYPLPKVGKGLNSKQNLGKLVERMTKQSIVANQEYNLETIFLGKRVQFVTLQNENGYSDVTPDSLKPVFVMPSKPVVSEDPVSKEGKVEEKGQ